MNEKAVHQKVGNDSYSENEAEVGRRLIVRLLFDGVVGDKQTVKHRNGRPKGHRDDVFFEVDEKNRGSQQQVDFGEDRIEADYSLDRRMPDVGLVLYSGSQQAHDQRGREQVDRDLDEAVGDGRGSEAANYAGCRGGQEVVGKEQVPEVSVQDQGKVEELNVGGGQGGAGPLKSEKLLDRLLELSCFLLLLICFSFH